MYTLLPGLFASKGARIEYLNKLNVLYVSSYILIYCKDFLNIYIFCLKFSGVFHKLKIEVVGLGMLLSGKVLA